MAKGGERFFGPDVFKFLTELELNNNRAWFERNKGRFEAEIKAPALRFIEAMGPRLARLSKHVVADPRPVGGSLYRIYRDTRFSKDKSPYKTWVGMHFSHDRSNKEENLPGFAFVIYPGECGVSSGIWHPTPPAAKKIRDAIVASPADWGKLVSKGLKVQGDAYVRVPAGYDPNHRYADALRQKDFYARKAIPDRVITSASLGDEFEAACRELDPLNRFLAKAISVPY